ncbi:MAG: GldG family protein [Lachnospiraceae bacterium]|nr:GldG family protein [Lachnospiraceae bacterium]
MNKNAKNEKNSFRTRRFKSGAYSTALIAAAVVIFFLVNLIVGRMDLVLDISAHNVYSLSEDTKVIAESLKDPISVNYIVTAGEEERLIENVVNNYEKFDMVTVNKVDPLLYPAFTAQYTKDRVSDNSVIVVNEKTGVSKYIPYADLLVLQLAQDKETGEYYNQATGVDAEGQITGAMMYVTAEELPIIYVVSGHNEQELNDTVLNEISKVNMKVETLETRTVSKIPEDCSVLMINGPAYDFSEDEIKMIQEYLEDGGTALIFHGYTDEPLSNLTGLLEFYGLTTSRGVMVEASGYYTGQYMTYLLPIATKHEIVASINQSVCAPVAQGFKLLKDVRSSLKVEPLYQTSQGSYLKINPNSQTQTQEMLDPSGPFVVAAAVTDEYQGKEAKLVVFSSNFFLDQSTVSYNLYGNSTVLVNAIDWAVELENSISIPSKNIEQTYLTMSSAEANTWMVVLTVALPATLLLAGFVIWYRRRRG